MHDGGLDTAAQKWKETYSVVDIRKFHALMKQFDKLQVNPVTLTSREQQGIPCLRAVIEQELAHDRFQIKSPQILSGNDQKRSGNRLK